MPKSSNLASMSVEALLKLRDDVTGMLNRRAVQLKEQLSRLTSEKAKRGRPAGSKSTGTKSARKDRRSGKVAPKYRGPGGETWSGRGLKPRWMSEALKGGAKVEDFLIAGGGGGKKASRGRKKKAG